MWCRLPSTFLFLPRTNHMSRFFQRVTDLSVHSDLDAPVCFFPPSPPPPPLPPSRTDLIFVMVRATSQGSLGFTQSRKSQKGIATPPHRHTWCNPPCRLCRVYSQLCHLDLFSRPEFSLDLPPTVPFHHVLSCPSPNNKAELPLAALVTVPPV